MQRSVLKNINSLCEKLLRTERNDLLSIKKLVHQGIQQKVIVKDTLPLIIQRCALHNANWVLAIQILQCEQYQKRGVQVDDNIWRIIDRAIPPEDSEAKLSASKALKDIFSKNRRD